MVPVAPITRVPTTPASLRGVMPLHDGAVPVIDLATRFGGGESGLGRFSCVVVVVAELEGRSVPVGLLSDRVYRVVELQPEEVGEVPDLGLPVHVEFLAGLGRAGDRLLPLLDVNRLLSIAELAAVAALPAPGNVPPEEIER